MEVEDWGLGFWFFWLGGGEVELWSLLSEGEGTDVAKRKDERVSDIKRPYRLSTYGCVTSSHQILFSLPIDLYTIFW